MRNAPSALVPFLVFAVSLCAPVAGRAGGGGADTDRPIVYAARYYNPPPSRATSHSHLYRINPDGTGRLQLTSGNNEEYRPLWSGDGKQIAFLRGQTEVVKGVETLTVSVCVMAARGGKVTTLATMKDGAPPIAFSPSAPALLALTTWPSGDYVNGRQVTRLVDTRTGQVVKKLTGASYLDWSPDGKRLLLVRSQGSGETASSTYSVYTVATGTETPVADKLGEAVCWAGPNRLVAKPIGENAGGELLVINAETGATTRRLTIAVAPEAVKTLQDSSTDLAYFYRLTPLPGDPNGVLYGSVAGNSTEGKWLYQYRVDTETGRMTYWAETGDLNVSPDRKRFCTSLGRDVASYGKRNGRDISVWVRPLYLVQTAQPDKRKPFISGLVVASGADWRR